MPRPKRGETVDVAGYDYVLADKAPRAGEWFGYRLSETSGKYVWSRLKMVRNVWVNLGGIYGHLGEILKLEGQRNAREHAALWMNDVTEKVRALTPGTTFTSELIVEMCGLPVGIVMSNRNNAVGGAVSALAKKGWIESTGTYIKSRRPSSHSAVILVWRRTEQA